MARASALAPINYVPELIGADTDSEPAIRWPIALMPLCCDPPAIATVAAALAQQHSSSAQNFSPNDRSALVEFAPTSQSTPGKSFPRKSDYSLRAARLCFFRFPYACIIVVNPPPRHWGECV